VRHLFMDVGDNFDLKSNTLTAWMTFGFSVLATIAFWAAIILGNSHV